MHTNLRMGPIQSSFLSVEKDVDIILRKLFVESDPHCKMLKRLLVANVKDCLDNEDSETLKKIDNMSIKELFDKGYIRTQPKISLPEHEEVKSYVIISFDNFTPNSTNPQFRDCVVSFDIFCHPEHWDLGGFRTRPLKIAGYIDGILHNSKLTGIGEFHFLGCNQLVLSQELSGYTLMYRAIHGSDDKLR